MRLHRKDPLLNEAIVALDQRLAQAKRAVPKAVLEEQIAYAWTLLAPLELEFVKEEIAHCIDDRLYYLGNYHVIQPEQGILTCLDPLYDHQLLVDETLVLVIERDGRAFIIVLKPRQSGLTEYCNGVMCWRTFFVPHAYTISVAQAPDVAAHIQRKITIAYDHLPWWMRSERQYHTKGEMIEFGRKDIGMRSIDPGLGSVFVTTHAMRETGVAIGRTVRSLHASEVSRWPSGEVYTGDIEPSMNAPDTIGFMESTAFGNEGFYYNLWEEAMEGDSDWTPVFLPAYRARKYSLPLKKSQIPFLLTPQEQSFTEKVKREEHIQITNEFWNWRRRRIKSSIKRTGFPYAHYESYPITPQEAFQSSGQGAFPRHKLDEQQQSNVCKPLWVGEIGYQGMNAAPKLYLNEMLDANGEYKDIALERRELTNRLYVWEQPRANAAYYLGSDVGDGIVGGDFSVIEVFRAGFGNEPDVQVAEWVGYEPPLAFAKIVYALGFWYNQCEVAVEYAREGMTTANSLMNDLQYPNLYRPRHADRPGKQLANYLHWQTTSKTKPGLLVRMNETLLEDMIVIHSQYLLDELRRCVKDGITFAGLGGHDDSAVAACLPAGSVVDTLSGGMRIETIRAGDSVLSDDGVEHKVTWQGSRRVDEEISRLKVFGLADDVVCTNNHPLLARKRLGSSPVRIAEQEWIPSGDLKKNDFVFVPMRKLPPCRLSEDELYLLGWYLSDGWASKRRGAMSFTLSSKDDETRLCAILREMIDSHPTCYRSGPRRNGYHERRASVIVKDFGTYKQVLTENVWVNEFLRYYGGNPKEKFVHPDIVNSIGTLPLVATFLMGDGSQTSKRMSITAEQKNAGVLRSIHRMLLDNGVWSSLHPGLNKRGRSVISICGEWVKKFLEQVPWAPFKIPPRIMDHPIARSAEGGFWAQIQRHSSEHFSGDVFNMEVEDRHTYLVNGVTMHNCISLYCLRETMPELRVQASSGETPSTTPERGARASAGACVYGIHDSFFRIITQTQDLMKAQEFVAKHPGYGIKKIMVSKANTAFSLIHHGRGIENELYRQEGVDPTHITPGLVTQYAAATGRLVQNGIVPQRPGGVDLPNPQLGANPPADGEFWGDLSSGSEL